MLKKYMCVCMHLRAHTQKVTQHKSMEKKAEGKKNNKMRNEQVAIVAKKKEKGS